MPPAQQKRRWWKWVPYAAILLAGAGVYVAYWLYAFPSVGQAHQRPESLSRDASHADFQIANSNGETWRAATASCNIKKLGWGNGIEIDTSFNVSPPSEPRDVVKGATITTECSLSDIRSVHSAVIDIVVHYRYRKFPLGPFEDVVDRYAFLGNANTPGRLSWYPQGIERSSTSTALDLAALRVQRNVAGQSSP
jgi:hypothetical protein